MPGDGGVALPGVTGAPTTPVGTAVAGEEAAAAAAAGGATGIAG